MAEADDRQQKNPRDADHSEAVAQKGAVGQVSDEPWDPRQVRLHGGHGAFEAEQVGEERSRMGNPDEPRRHAGCQDAAGGERELLDTPRIVDPGHAQQNRQRPEDVRLEQHRRHAEAGEPGTVAPHQHQRADGRPQEEEVELPGEHAHQQRP